MFAGPGKNAAFPGKDSKPGQRRKTKKPAQRPVRCRSGGSAFEGQTMMSVNDNGVGIGLFDDAVVKQDARKVVDFMLEDNGLIAAFVDHDILVR